MDVVSDSVLSPFSYILKSKGRRSEYVGQTAIVSLLPSMAQEFSNGASCWDLNGPQPADLFVLNPPPYKWLTAFWAYSIANGSHMEWRSIIRFRLNAGPNSNQKVFDSLIFFATHLHANYKNCHWKKKGKSPDFMAKKKTSGMFWVGISAASCLIQLKGNPFPRCHRLF